MTCRELIQFLMDYLDGELPASQRRAFEQHLRLCPDCRSYLASYRRTIALEKATLGEPLARRGKAPRAKAKTDASDAAAMGAPESLIQAILKARKSR